MWKTWPLVKLGRDGFLIGSEYIIHTDLKKT